MPLLTGRKQFMGINIEVAYALPDKQTVITLEVAPGTTVGTAIEQSNIRAKHPDINLNENKVGIFGEIVTMDTVCEANDRIEIYRPLKQDPKEARRLRAARQAAHQK